MSDGKFSTAKVLVLQCLDMCEMITMYPFFRKVHGHISVCGFCHHLILLKADIFLQKRAQCTINCICCEKIQISPLCWSAKQNLGVYKAVTLPSIPVYFKLLIDHFIYPLHHHLSVLCPGVLHVSNLGHKIFIFRILDFCSTSNFLCWIPLLTVGKGLSLRLQFGYHAQLQYQKHNSDASKIQNSHSLTQTAAIYILTDRLALDSHTMCLTLLLTLKMHSLEGTAN
jgi:hypothetical protein